MAAPSYRSTGSVASPGRNSYVTQLTPGEPAGAAVGDILIAQCAVLIPGSSSQSCIWPQGWTEIVFKEVAPFWVCLAWIRRGATAPDLEFEITPARNSWSVAVHAISGAVGFGDPLDPLDGTEYVTGQGAREINWQPSYTPTTTHEETLAMSMVFTNDNNRLGLLSGSGSRSFIHRFLSAMTVNGDRAMALATRQLTSVTTLVMPTHRQFTSAPDSWAGAFIAITAGAPTPPTTANYLIRALP